MKTKTKKISAMSFMFAVMSAFMFCDSSFAANSTLVTQPAYHSMSFYVHKPVNVPRDFYVTYDGYLVYKDERGVWHYGSAEKDGIIRTGYVVGSVIPSVVRLKPYNAKISSVAPILNTKTPPSVVTGKTAERDIIIYSPPKSPIYSESNSPVWAGSSTFLAIGKWNKTVSKIGVTDVSSIPVAWKGDYPEVVYAWTGVRWKQIDSNGKNITALSTIRRELYDLIVEINRTNALNWTHEDSRLLAQYADRWGYQWVGLVVTNGGIR